MTDQSSSDRMDEADYAKSIATKVHRAEWSLLKKVCKIHIDNEEDLSAEIISRRSAALSTLFAMNSLAFAMACEAHANAVKGNE